MAGNMIFAVRIKKLREEHGDSQSVLANLTGYQKQAVSHWENSGKVPRSDVLKVLAEYYETTIDYLLGFQAEQTAPTNDAVEISPDESKLLVRYRMMSEDQKDTIQRVAENIVPLSKS